MSTDNYRFDSRWFHGEDAANVENIKTQLVSDKISLDKLREIVYNIVIKERDVRKVDYSSPSWSHLQAHRNGMLEAYCSIIRLVTLDPELIDPPETISGT